LRLKGSSPLKYFAIAITKKDITAIGARKSFPFFFSSEFKLVFLSRRILPQLKNKTNEKANPSLSTYFI